MIRKRTIHFVVIFHVQERIEINVTVEVDIWLNAPIPLVLLQDLVTIEEAGVEAAHVPI